MGIIDWIRGRRQEQAQRNRTPREQFVATFNSLSDVEKYVFWRSQSSQGDFDSYTSQIPGFGHWVNAMDYHALANGVPVTNLRWDAMAGAIRGPFGIMRNPVLTWATFDGLPPAGYRAL